MLNLKTLVLVSGIGAALAFTGCETNNHQSSDRTEGRKVDDNSISESVQHDLDQEPAYKFTDVRVQTFAGVVQLSGFVNTQGQKQRAGEIARQEPGVAQVVNNITLKPTPSLAPTSRPTM